MNRKKRVAMAMSGGVDSATAAACLVEQGYEVIGLTMRLLRPHAASSNSRTCCASDDVEDARRVAQTLGITFYVIDMERAFQEAVVDDYLANYASGHTPNPCVRCNQVLKFHHLLQTSKSLEADFLATGHYAIRRETASGVQLWRGKDRKKDQSYFLFTLTPAQLRDVRFPLGEMTKETTRALAERYGLHLAHKHESQDLCFVPDGDSAAFLASAKPDLLTPGPIVDQAGRILGEHRGLGRYTIGQRKGLGISSPQPCYVMAIQADANRLVVGSDSDLLHTELVVRDVNWLGEQPFEAPRPIHAKIRYMAEAQPARLIPHPPSGAHITFDAPQRAITPGQACVFYSGDRVLGGGWIQRNQPPS